MTDRRPLSRSSAVAAALAFVLVAALAGPVGPAAAGDRTTQLLFQPDAAEASAGETVEIRVMAQSHGGYDGTGVAELEFAVRYDPDAVGVVDVERGPWLASGHDEDGGDAAIDSTVDVDEDAGAVSVEQRREPADEGVTGYGTVLVLTVEVADDLGPSTVALEFDESAADLADGSPQSTYERSGEIAVDGGGPERTPPPLERTSDERGDAERGESEAGNAVTTTDDPSDGTDGAGVDSSGADEDDGSAGNGIPGFGALAALAALGALGSAALRRRSRADRPDP